MIFDFPLIFSAEHDDLEYVKDGDLVRLMHTE